MCKTVQLDTVGQCFYSAWYCGLLNRANIDILQTSLYNNITAQSGNKLNGVFAVRFWFLFADWK